jgi:hypothetical protein
MDDDLSIMSQIDFSVLRIFLELYATSLMADYEYIIMLLKMRIFSEVFTII